MNQIVLSVVLITLVFNISNAQGKVIFESSTPSETVLKAIHLTGPGIAIEGISTNGLNSIGVSGQSQDGYGVTGSSGFVGVMGFGTDGSGVFGQSTDAIGVFGRSENGFSLRGISSNFHGAWFSGKVDGTNFGDIVLGGSDGSSEGDNGIIKSDPDYPESDIILVSNDNVTLHLDDDNNSAGDFVIKNGGNTNVFTVSEDGTVTVNGTTVHSSDRNRKEQINSINQAVILQSLSQMPIYEWQYKSQERRHIGPMAQDFHFAFDLGQDDTTIASIDADGVALAAIKAVHEENIIQRDRIDSQQSEIDILKQEVAELKTLLREQAKNASED